MKKEQSAELELVSRVGFLDNADGGACSRRSYPEIRKFQAYK